MAGANLVRVKEGFISRDITFRVGDVLSADDPVVKKMPAEYFEALEPRSSVEQATAAPGEQRKTKAG